MTAKTNTAAPPIMSAIAVVMSDIERNRAPSAPREKERLNSVNDLYGARHNNY
jgi:hypothetical protein